MNLNHSKVTPEMLMALVKLNRSTDENIADWFERGKPIHSQLKAMTNPNHAKIEQAIIDTMLLEPDRDISISDGCSTIHSTKFTHHSYREALLAAKKGTGYYRTVLTRCQHFIKLCKKNSVQFVKV